MIPPKKGRPTPRAFRKRQGGRRVLPALIVLVLGACRTEEDFRRLVDDPEKSVRETWCFPGGDMEPAQMIFWSNGLLEVRSEIFDDQVQARFFTWSRPPGDTTLVVGVAQAELWPALAETDHARAIAVDEARRTITYRSVGTSRTAVFFAGWRFDRDLCDDG